MRAKLDTTFDVVNGVALEKVMATIGRLADRNARTGLGIRRTGRTAENANRNAAEVWSCPRGGELLQSADGGRFGTDIEGRDCAIGPIVFSGHVQFSGPIPQGAFRPESINATRIELDDARDLSTITMGQGFYLPGQGDLRFAAWSAFDLSVERPQRPYALSSATGSGLDRNNALPDGTLGLTARASGLTGPFPGTAELNTRGPFESTGDRADGRPRAGRLTIGTASDNLAIDASNGDPNTFTLTVTSDGATTSYTVPFSDTYRFEAPVIIGVDLGF